MPPKIRQDDWDRLFAPNAPRRGGPLRTLGNILFLVLLIGILGGSIVFALGYRAQQTASFNATATVIAPTLAAQQAATAQVPTQRALDATATALAKPTAVAAIGRGVVINGGNLRNEPQVAPETVTGLIWPGDEVAFLEQQIVGKQPWFRVRVEREAGNRGGAGVPVGTEGWVSASLLSSLTPVPAE